MVNPITITKAEAQAKIRAAYDEGRLTAQLPKSKSAYEYGGSMCAIGCLFGLEAAIRLEDASKGYRMAADLIYDDILIVPSSEAGWFKTVQNAHDEWSYSRRDGISTAYDTAYLEAHFLNMLRPDAETALA